MANFTLNDFVATKISSKLANRIITESNQYADGVGSSTLGTAKSYADSVGTNTLSSAKSYADALMPTGTMIFYAGPNIPAGFLLCNGAAVSRTTYANLFSKIGTYWGAGDGSTTFNVPDLRDRVIQGVNTYSLGTAIPAGLPNITGNLFIDYGDNKTPWMRGFTAFTAFTRSGYTAGRLSQSGYGSSVDGNPNSLSFNANSSNSLYGKASIVQPAAASTYILIKI